MILFSHRCLDQHRVSFSVHCNGLLQARDGFLPISFQSYSGIPISKCRNECCDLLDDPRYRTFLVSLPCTNRFGTIAIDYQSRVVGSASPFVTHECIIQTHSWNGNVLWRINGSARPVLILLMFAPNTPLAPRSEREVRDFMFLSFSLRWLSWIPQYKAAASLQSRLHGRPQPPHQLPEH